MAYKFNPFTGKLEEYGPILTGTGTVAAAADGTAALPGISFANDLSVGIYRPGPEQLALSTNGTGRLFVDASGNVSLSSTTSLISTNTADAADNKRLILTGGGAIGVERGAYINLQGNEFSGGGNASIVAGDNGYISFNTGSGNERLRITSAGNVGIGTSSPSALLHVSSTGAVESLLSGGGTAGDTVLHLKGNSNAYKFIVPNAAVQYGMGLYDVGNAAYRLFVTGAGNVGIGTTSPVSPLTVNQSNSSIGGGLTINSDTAGYPPSLRFRDNVPDTSNLGTLAADRGFKFILGASTEAARIDSSGRLLVGTSTTVPNSNNDTVQVAGTGGTNIGLSRFVNTFAGPEVSFYKSRNGTVGSHTVVQTDDILGNFYFYGSSGSNYQEAARISAVIEAGTKSTTSMPGRLVFSTTADGASSPTERMRIGSTGELWINRTTRDGDVGSNCKLQVLCTAGEWATVIRNSNASPYGLRVTTDTDANNTSNAFLGCYGAGNQRATIRSNGGLANYQSNNVDLSDERTKRDIAPALSTWNCVQAWEVVNYNYIDDAADDASRVGVIAQQVQQHCPEVVIPYQEAEDAVLDEDGNVVTPAKEERLGVREQQMMWMAIKALQEAQIRIETLEAEVTALKAS